MSEKKTLTAHFFQLCLLLSSLSFILILSRNKAIKANLDLRLVTKEWFVESKYLKVIHKLH